MLAHISRPAYTTTACIFYFAPFALLLLLLLKVMPMKGLRRNDAAMKTDVGIKKNITANYSHTFFDY